MNSIHCKVEGIQHCHNTIYLNTCLLFTAYLACFSSLFCISHFIIEKIGKEKSPQVHHVSSNWLLMSTIFLITQRKKKVLY